MVYFVLRQLVSVKSKLLSGLMVVVYLSCFGFEGVWRITIKAISGVTGAKEKLICHSWKSNSLTMVGYTTRGAVNCQGSIKKISAYTRI